MTMLNGHLLVPLPDQEQGLRTRMRRRPYACRLPSGRLKEASGQRRLERYCPHCIPLLRHRRCLFASAANAAHRRHAVRAWLLEQHRLKVFERRVADCAGAMWAFARQHPWAPGLDIGRYRRTLPPRVMLELYTNQDGCCSLTLEGGTEKLNEEMIMRCRDQLLVPAEATSCETKTRRVRMVRWMWTDEEKAEGSRQNRSQKAEG